MHTLSLKTRERIMKPSGGKNNTSNTTIESSYWSKTKPSDYPEIGTRSRDTAEDKVVADDERLYLKLQ